jgi:hypothetical protein
MSNVTYNLDIVKTRASSPRAISFSKIRGFRPHPRVFEGDGVNHENEIALPLNCPFGLFLEHDQREKHAGGNFPETKLSLTLSKSEATIKKRRA